jgi:hypothetical protein
MTALERRLSDVAKDPCFDFPGFTRGDPTPEVLDEVVRVFHAAFDATARARIFGVMAAAVYLSGGRCLASRGYGVGSEFVRGGCMIKIGPDGMLSVRPLDHPADHPDASAHYSENVP